MQEILNSLPAPMQINITTLVIAVMFLVLVVILNSLIFKPLIAVLEKRKSQIEEGEEARIKAEKTVQESLAAYREKVHEARKKAQANRQNLLKESEMAREEKIASSREKALAMVQAAATELDQQVGSARSSLEQESRVIAQQIVSSVLARATA